MVSWAISRHPEWDLMYLAGLTAKEISVACRANVATVHRHVKIRNRYEPGYQDKHSQALAQRSSERPGKVWLENYAKLERFFREVGRLPRAQGGSKVEMQLYNWLLAQRRKLLKQDLTRFKQHMLAKFPGWNEQTWENILEERWRLKLDELLIFVAEFEKMPKYRNYSTPREKTLGIWLHSQHQSRTLGRLSPERLAKLDQTIPGWKSYG